MDIKDKWNERYKSATHEPQAARVLSEFLHLLPSSGHALDLACGRGANAVLLARQGLQVDAWDIADIPIADLQKLALEKQLNIHAEVRDVETQPPEPNIFDVIVVSYFLDRKIIPALIMALKPEGLVYYQTFKQQHVSERGPKSTGYRLAEQELLQLFSGLQVLLYHEEGRVGNIQKGFRDEAMFIGRKKSMV